MQRSAALTTETHAFLTQHLLRADRQEDLCFAVWHSSGGEYRTTALIQPPLLPHDGERDVHGNASFKSEYFMRAVGEAQAAGGGVALLHSHPGARGWQGMSQPDIETERRHAPRAFAATGAPFVGLTMAGDGALSARFWERVGRGSYEPRSCMNVRSVGDRIAVTWDDALVPPPPLTAGQTRTVSAWGDQIQRDWSRLRIGVIGAGSVGALVGEALVRSGATRLLVLDFDTVEEINLDRLLHATRRDVALVRPKVDVLVRGLQRSATAQAAEIEGRELSVLEQGGMAAALDCDVLFSCVDRPWPRAALNYLAYVHLIPVVDVGIRVRKTKRGRLRIADWRASVAAPGRGCLACTAQYDPAHVRVERDGSLDDPRYIERLPEDSPLRASENVFGFSLGAASMAVSQFLSIVVAPGGVSNHGTQRYRFNLGSLEREWPSCNPNCSYKAAVGEGDPAEPRFDPIGPHPAAASARDARIQATRGPFMRMARVLDNLIWRYR